MGGGGKHAYVILEQHDKMTRMTDREARGAGLGVDLTRSGNSSAWSIWSGTRAGIMIDPGSNALLMDISLIDKIQNTKSISLTKPLPF